MGHSRGSAQVHRVDIRESDVTLRGGILSRRGCFFAEPRLQGRLLLHVLPVPPDCLPVYSCKLRTCRYKRGREVDIDCRRLFGSSSIDLGRFFVVVIFSLLPPLLLLPTDRLIVFDGGLQ